MLRTSKTAEQYTDEGNHFFQQMDFQNAANSYAQSLRSRPNHALTLSNYGAALYRLGRLEEAKESIEKSLQIDDNFANAHSNLALILRDIGLRHSGTAMAQLHFQAALVHYRKALDSQQPSIDDLCDFASFLLSVKELDQALLIYNQITQKNSKHPKARSGMAKVFFSMGQEAKAEDKQKFYTAAFENVDLGLSAHPNDPELLAIRGTLLFTTAEGEAEKIGQAIGILQRSLKLKADQAFALNNLGTAFHALKKYDKAVEAYEKCLQLNPNYPGTRDNIVLSLIPLAAAYFEADQYQKAATAFLRVLDFNPNDAETIGNLGACYDGLEQYDKAIIAYERCLAINPNHAGTKDNIVRLRKMGITASTAASSSAPNSSSQPNANASVVQVARSSGSNGTSQHPQKHQQAQPMQHQYDQHRQQARNSQRANEADNARRQPASGCCVIL